MNAQKKRFFSVQFANIFSQILPLLSYGIRA